MSFFTRTSKFTIRSVPKPKFFRWSDVNHGSNSALVVFRVFGSQRVDGVNEKQACFGIVANTVRGRQNKNHVQVKCTVHVAYLSFPCGSVFSLPFSGSADDQAGAKNDERAHKYSNKPVTFTTVIRDALLLSTTNDKDTNFHW
jgi:hypothetical protein